MDLFKIKFAECGSSLGSSQLSLLSKLPPKMTLKLKMVKINPKIFLLKSKSGTHSVGKIIDERDVNFIINVLNS
jgi:hypothetical protein